MDASNAPKAVTLGDKPTMNVSNKPPIQRCSLSPIGGAAMGGPRSLTPSPEKSAHSNDLRQRRAITPNPEPPVGQVRTTFALEDLNKSLKCVLSNVFFLSII